MNSGWAFALGGVYGFLFNEQHEQTKNAAKAAEYQAEYESKSALNQAEQEKLDRRANAKKESKEAKRRRAGMEAAYSKSGVLLDGTPSNYINEQIETDELNIALGNQASKQRGLGLKVSAQNALIRGKNQSRALRRKATTDLISNVVGVSSQFASQMGGGSKDSSGSSSKSSSWWS